MFFLLFPRTLLLDPQVLYCLRRFLSLVPLIGGCRRLLPEPRFNFWVKASVSASAVCIYFITPEITLCSQGHTVATVMYVQANAPGSQGSQHGLILLPRKATLEWGSDGCARHSVTVPACYLADKAQVPPSESNEQPSSA